MKIVITAPIQGISKSEYSHRSAKAYIYQSVYQELYPGARVDIDVGNKCVLSEYDLVAVYHGDYSGSLNLFGGLDNFNDFSIGQLSNVEPEKIISLEMPMPDYVGQLVTRAKNDENHPKLSRINFQGWSELMKAVQTTGTWTPIEHKNLVLGDSHSIALYRPGWTVWQIPFRTLYGSLKDNKKNISELIKEYSGKTDGLENIELYFGNIDIRHHLCRDTTNDDERVAKTMKLVQAYGKKAKELSGVYDCNINLIAALPIECESRKLPKSGYYKDAPFCGTWEERNRVKDVFNQTLENIANNTPGLTYVNPWETYTNSNGELSFEFMERPRSVHLARASYPYWTGLPEANDLSAFLE